MDLSYLGTFDLEGIHQSDWEDITMLEENGVHYIYIGDIGNNHSGHCRGVNWPQMRAIKFPEPDLDQLRYIHSFYASIHAFIFHCA